MLRVNIKKEGVITNSALFNDQVSLDDWLEQETANGSFGDPASYIIEQLDVTEEMNHLKKMNEARVAMDKGRNIIAFIWALNDGKQISVEDTIALAQDQQASLIQTLLHNGALATAAGLISAYDGVWFTSDDKIKILNYIGA